MADAASNTISASALVVSSVKPWLTLFRRAALFLILASSMTGTNQTANDSELAHLQRVVASSKRVQRILKQAEAGGRNRISFAVLHADSTHPFQGYTTPLEGGDKKGVTVHIVGGLSNQLTELLIAHELFHIVLKNQGWPSQAHTSLSEQELDTTFQGAITRDTEAALMSCYPDALIDRWMSKRGFAPKLVNRRQYQLTIMQAKTTERPPPQVFVLWRKNVALVNYCLSIRERDFEMKDVFRAFESVDPEMAHDQSLLEKQLGTRLECDDVPSCLEATKQLRHASGFEGQIAFLNPRTNKWE
jgi:hypothetical protein